MIEVRACKTVTRVSVPFTEGHYCGKGERPNTGLADNSPFTCRKTRTDKREMHTKRKLDYKDGNDVVQQKNQHLVNFSLESVNSLGQDSLKINVVLLRQCATSLNCSAHVTYYQSLFPFMTGATLKPLFLSTCLLPFHILFSLPPMQPYEILVQHFAFSRHVFFEVYDTVSMHWHEPSCRSPVRVREVNLSAFLSWSLIILLKSITLKGNSVMMLSTLLFSHSIENINKSKR